ncbi:MAG: hypothetical protein ACRC0M_11025, partial [Legionella sp.]
MDSSGNGLKLLMPVIEGHDQEYNEATNTGFKELDQVPLPQLLRTHIIGDEGNYLIPAAHLLQLSEGVLGRAEGAEWQMNPYYTTELAKEAAVLSETEIRRLWQHSSGSRALERMVGELRDAEKKQPTLLSQLRTLYKSLSLYDAHGGAGQADKAGEGVYAAITNFFIYYDRLLTNNQANIPEEIKKELETLRDFGGNFNAKGNSCIGLRAEALSPLIKTHEDALESITISSEESSALRETAEENYTNANAALGHCLTNDYSGSDKLGLTCELIHWLGISFSVTDPDDFALFMRLTAADMQLMLDEDPNIGQELIDAHETLEDVITLLTSGYELDRLNVVLNYLATRKAELFTPGVLLGRVLGVLGERQSALFVDILVQKVFTNAEQLATVLRYLNEEQRITVLEAVKNRLPTLITNEWQLETVWRFLNKEQRATVIKAVENKLPTLITSADQLATVLVYLNEEQRIAVFEAVKDKLPTLITSADQLTTVLRVLNKEQRTIVYEAVKDELP